MLADEGQVQPIIEPVKNKFGSLVKTLDASEKKKLTNWVVVNPALLDFRKASESDRLAWGLAAFGEMKARKTTRPTLLVSDALTPTVVKRFVQAFKGEEIGLAITPTSLDLAKVVGALAGVTIQRVFFKTPSPTQTNVTLFEKPKCVWVEDRFPHRPRNADYAGRHPFTDKHLTWKASGWAGFSDYTILPPQPSDGGGPPGAVAFHMTHIHLAKPQGEIWVEHFVSDETNQAVQDNDGKFMEALAKFKKATKRADSSFGVTEAASDYLNRANTNDPPALGTNKQLEVEHHLELMSGVLAGRF